MEQIEVRTGLVVGVLIIGVGVGKMRGDGVGAGVVGAVQVAVGAASVAVVAAAGLLAHADTQRGDEIRDLEVAHGHVIAVTPDPRLRVVVSRAQGLHTVGRRGLGHDLHRAGADR